MLFSYEIKKVQKAQVVYFWGELIERSQANEMITAVQTLLEQNEVNIILDLTNLKYMNSSGLNVLINLLTKTRNMGGEVFITNVNKKIKELLIITKLTSMFNVTDTTDQALARIN